MATLAVMRSKPDDFYRAHFRILYFVSFGVNDLTRSVRRREEFNENSTVFMLTLSII